MSHLKYVFLSLGLAWCEILSVQAGVMGAQILNAPDDARFEFAEPTPHGFPSALRTRVFYPDHEALGRAIDEIRVKPPKPASPRPPSQAPAAGSLPADGEARAAVVRLLGPRPLAAEPPRPLLPARVRIADQTARR